MIHSHHSRVLFTDACVFVPHSVLADMRIIHTDINPENIVIEFGEVVAMWQMHGDEFRKKVRE